MPRPTHILTVRTRDGSALDAASALGGSETTIGIYDRHDLSRRLGAAEMRPDLDVSWREADERDWVGR